MAEVNVAEVRALSKGPTDCPVAAASHSQGLAGKCLFGLAWISGLILMWPMFTSGPLVLDEHGSYWMIDSDLPGSVWERSLNYAAIPPLSGWLQDAFLLTLGKSEFAFRLPSAVCYLAAIVVVYRVASGLADQSLGGIAALILAWHPEAMDEVRIARCYGLVLLMSSLVLLTTTQCLRSASSARRAVWSLLWSLSAAGLLWTHYTSALLVVISSAWIGLSSILSRQRSVRGTYWLLSNLILAFLCLPLIPTIQRLQDWGPYLNYMSADQPIWKFVGPVWWIGLPLGWLLCRILTFWYRDRVSFNSGAFLLLLACSLVPLLLLAALASGDLSSLANPRYRVAYAPAGACLLAMVFRYRSTWQAAVAGTTVAITVSWLMSPLPPWKPGRLGNPTDREWCDASLYLSQRSAAGESLFVQGGLAESSLVPVFFNDPLFMEYVACRGSRFYLESARPRIGLPYLWDGHTEMQSEFQRILAAIGSSSEPTFWVAAATDTDLNRISLDGMQNVATSSGFVATEYREWPHLKLIRYSRTENRSKQESP